MAEMQHKALAGGKWFELSLCSQLGNIGSEIGRAARWQNKDYRIFESAVFRAIELLDLTLSDPRWRYRCKEITRAKEVLGDTFLGGKEFNSTFQSLEKYFYHFAYAARNGN